MDKSDDSFMTKQSTTSAGGNDVAAGDTAGDDLQAEDRDLQTPGAPRGTNPLPDEAEARPPPGYTALPLHAVTEFRAWLTKNHVLSLSFLGLGL